MGHPLCNEYQFQKIISVPIWRKMEPWRSCPKILVPRTGKTLGHHMKSYFHFTSIISTSIHVHKTLTKTLVIQDLEQLCKIKPNLCTNDLT